MEKDKDVGKVKSNIEGLELYSDQYPFRLPLRVRNFDNESEYVKFIKACERNVRNSVEYRHWKNYIIDILGINTCMITEERMDQCTIEVHHHLPSLFVLIKSIINEKIEKEEEFCSFDIAREAIEIHFKNRVGYITLIKSIHEKFHNGFLSIPIELIKGNYKQFVNDYSSHMDDDDLDTINQRLSINEGNCSWSRDNYPGSVNGYNRSNK
jgi:hypothetical protein